MHSDHIYDEHAADVRALHRLRIGSDAVVGDIGFVPKPIDPQQRLRRRLLRLFREAVRGSRDLSKLFRAGKSFPTLHRVFEVFPGIATDSVMLKPDRAGVFHPTQQPQHLRYIIRAAVQWLDQLFPARAAGVRAVDRDAE